MESSDSQSHSNRVSRGSSSSASAHGRFRLRASNVSHRPGTPHRSLLDHGGRLARASLRVSPRVSPLLINIEESPLSNSRKSSDDLSNNGHGHRAQRSGRNVQPLPLVDLCIDADAVAEGSGSVIDSRDRAHAQKRNREGDDKGESSNKRVNNSASSVDAAIEGDTALSSRSVPSRVRSLGFRRPRPSVEVAAEGDTAVSGLAGPSRVRGLGFRRRRSERLPRINETLAANQNRSGTIVVNDLDSPVQIVNEERRGRDRERLRSQVAADERLARNLQGAYESDDVVGEENDAYLARILQEQENLRITGNDASPWHTTTMVQSVLPPGRSVRGEYRNHADGSRFRLMQRVTAGRSARARPPVRFHRQLPAGPGRRLPFPSSMAVETRLEILAALEATIQEQFTEAFHLMEVDRDFNENDYEMLLALDDNVGRGASQAKIDLLPTRTLLPTDVVDEACSICLEIPVTGEVARRLPCMHEFHQECIDQWLRRQVVCPICKADLDLG